MMSSRLGKMVATSVEDRSSSLSRGLEKTVWRTLNIRTWACSVANNSGWRSSCGKKQTDRQFTILPDFQSTCSFTVTRSLFPLSSPLMTSCLLVSFLLRLASASWGAISLQFGGSTSNSSRRGSISSSWGEGLVGEGPGPSEPETAPSKLRNKKWHPDLINLLKWAVLMLYQSAAKELVMIH